MINSHLKEKLWPTRCILYMIGQDKLFINFLDMSSDRRSISLMQKPSQHCEFIVIEIEESNDTGTGKLIFSCSCCQEQAFIYPRKTHWQLDSVILTSTVAKLWRPAWTLDLLKIWLVNLSTNTVTRLCLQLRWGYPNKSIFVFVKDFLICPGNPRKQMRCHLTPCVLIMV